MKKTITIITKNGFAVTIEVNLSKGDELLESHLSNDNDFVFFIEGEKEPKSVRVASKLIVKTKAIMTRIIKGKIIMTCQTKGKNIVKK